MAGVFVRGLTGNKVNVFVDGVRFSNGAQRGGVNTFLNLIDPAGDRGIEVLRGPSAPQYGSDALGGSVQFLTKLPTLAPTGSTFGGEVVGRGRRPAHHGGGGNASLSWRHVEVRPLRRASRGRKTGELTGPAAASIRTPRSRAFSACRRRSADRTTGCPTPASSSSTASCERTGSPSSRHAARVEHTCATRQDGAQPLRSDAWRRRQPDRRAERSDARFVLRAARSSSSAGWFDHASVTYSFNSQREERVNQGGQGNPTATIGHEPERTTVNGVQVALDKALSRGRLVQVGGDSYFEKLTSDAVQHQSGDRRAIRPPAARAGATPPSCRAACSRRRRFDAVPDRLELVGAIRVGHAATRRSAADAPVVERPAAVARRFVFDDERDVPRRATAPRGPRSLGDGDWSFVVSASRGFRAPHMTDLGTLGLTGSGFEVAAPDVAGPQRLRRHDRRRHSGFDGRSGRTAGARNELQRRRRASGIASRKVSAEFTVFVEPHLRQHPEADADPAAGRRGHAARDRADHGSERRRRGLRRRRDDAGAGARQFRQRAQLGLRAPGTLSAIGRVQPAHGVYVLQRQGHQDRPRAEHRGRHSRPGWLCGASNTRPPGGKWWVQPYLHAAGEQSNLSTLDLGDRRTAAPRNRNNMRAFFLNGATNRGWVSAGPDGVIGIGRRRPDRDRRNHRADSGSRARCGRQFERAVFRGAELRHLRGSRGRQVRRARDRHRRGELQRRELPRHFLGHRRTGARHFRQVP